MGTVRLGLGSEILPPVSRVRTQQFREAARVAKVTRKVTGGAVEPLVWLCWKSLDSCGPFTGYVTSGSP